MRPNIVLDKQTAIERIGGDEELYNELIEMFFEDVPEQLSMLKEALSAENRVVGQRHSHSLKSAAANIGGESMRYSCSKAESSFSTEPLEVLVEIVNQIEADFNRLKQEFHK